MSPIFLVSVGDERLSELRAASPDICDEFLERDEIYSEIAARLPKYNRVMLHGACISYKDKAYLFTAPSGTGKSTHVGLWQRYLGDNVTIINGDKPIFYIRESGSVCAFGTPWCGKEGWNRNESADLAGICFMKRGIENKIRRAKPDDAAPFLLRQMFLPKEPEAAALTLGLLDRIVSAIPAYLLECDMSEDAVRTSFEALTGEKYK